MNRNMHKKKQKQNGDKEKCSKSMDASLEERNGLRVITHFFSST